ncbi:hypothetical protein GKR75_08060 [Providencia sp. wls1919]|nr:hypothetical protein [Providencia sp. wls1919]
MKNNLLIAFSLFLWPMQYSFSASLGPAIVESTIINIRNGDQAGIRVSNTEPNLLVIKGDKITAVNSNQGSISSIQNTQNGGLVFSTLNTKPFTFVIETEKGGNYSFNATPQKIIGRTFTVENDEPGNNLDSLIWEKSDPYTNLLVELNRKILLGKIPIGYKTISYTEVNKILKKDLTLNSKNKWIGNYLEVTEYQLKNTGFTNVKISENDFLSAGVRAVVFEPRAETLIGGGSMKIFITTSTRGN